MSEQPRTRDDRNYFTLFAAGEEFDVDTYAKASTLPIDRIYHRGDPILGSEKHRSERSGFEIILGDGLDLDIQEQQVIALEFLSKYTESLLRLRAMPEITLFYFGLQQNAFSNSLGSIFDFSPLLMKAALEIDIGVTIWFCLSGPYPGGLFSNAPRS